MRRYAAYAGLLASILLVGAGCAAKQGANVNVGADVRMEDEGGKNGGMEGKIEVEGSSDVDGTVNAIMMDLDDEKEANAEIEKNAEEVESDKAELNAYGTSSYEVK